MDSWISSESWYLANVMQFYMLYPLMTYPLWRCMGEIWSASSIRLHRFVLGCPINCSHYYRRTRTTINDGKVCISMSNQFLLILHNISAVIVKRGVSHLLIFKVCLKMLSLRNEVCMWPWSRVQFYIVGVWLGWIFSKTRGKQVKFPMLAVICLWMASTAMALLFTLSTYISIQKIRCLIRYFFAAWGRTSFATAIAIVIFCCVKGLSMFFFPGRFLCHLAACPFAFI